MSRPRPRRAVAALVPALFLLGACTGSGDASQGSVRDDVRETLLEGEGARSPAVASGIADCVARGMFEGDFSKEERNDAARAADGDDPDPELVERVQALFDDCEAEVGEGAGDGGESQTSDDADE